MSHPYRKCILHISEPLGYSLTLHSGPHSSTEPDTTVLSHLKFQRFPHASPCCPWLTPALTTTWHPSSRSCHHLAALEAPSLVPYFCLSSNESSFEGAVAVVPLQWHCRFCKARRGQILCFLFTADSQLLPWCLAQQKISKWHRGIGLRAEK